MADTHVDGDTDHARKPGVGGRRSMSFALPIGPGRPGRGMVRQRAGES